MAQGALSSYLKFGTIGDRPVTPTLMAGVPSLYWATDEDILYIWDGAWADSASVPSLALNDLTNVIETAPVAGQLLEYNGTNWVNVAKTYVPPPIVTEATAARTAIPADANQYTRFTLGTAKTYTFTDVETYVVNTEFFGRNVGATDLTLTAGGTMVLNAPAGGTLVVPPGGSFAVKIVGASEADVTGYTVAV